MTGPIDSFDCIVVGAGSSGGVVAARLSEDPARRVLLLEAGPDFPQERSRPPAFFAGGNFSGERSTGNGPPTPDLDWGYWSEPLADGRRVPLARGRMVGGTSMANGCVAVRGRPSDFEAWEATGAAGWGWEDVLPFYAAVEAAVPIKTYPPELWLPIQLSFRDGWLEAGFRYAEDFDGPDAWDGVVGPWPRNRRNEIRQGTLVTYIRAARERPNLTIHARALVDRVVIEDGRATGVRYITRGAARIARADRVIVCAGAYGSPAILLRSGIGPADELRALGVEPLLDLPVGRHLMEHPAIAFAIRTDPGHARMGFPDIAVAARGDGWWSMPIVIDEEAGVSAVMFCLALTDGPDGTLRLRTAEPGDAPEIDHRYRDVIHDGSFEPVHAAFRTLLETSVYRSLDATYLHAHVPFAESVRRALTTGAHPAGGCDIGRVVAPDLTVLGVDGLSVADASVFPRHVSNNPNLTCFMVGERAAAFVAGSARRTGETPTTGHA